jgi:hypothetical protein
VRRSRPYRPLPALGRSSSGITHALAECVDCDWRNENRKNALATGSIHARRTGHFVMVEQVLSVFYNRRDDALTTGAVYEQRATDG